LAEDTDKELVKRVQKGDLAAFDMLFAKYQVKVLNLVARYVRDQEEVKDVTQDAFIKAYRALPKFRGDSAFYTWLYRIAVNTAKNYLVARSRRPPSSDVDLADAEYYSGSDQLKDVSSPENQLFRDELEAVINQAIVELPEDLRTAVTLREYEGLSYEDIAAVMDCPVGTIRSRIFRGRESIDARVLELIEGV